MKSFMLSKGQGIKKKAYSTKGVKTSQKVVMDSQANRQLASLPVTHLCPVHKVDQPAVLQVQLICDADVGGNIWNAAFFAFQCFVLKMTVNL